MFQGSRSKIVYDLNGSEDIVLFRYKRSYPHKLKVREEETTLRMALVLYKIDLLLIIWTLYYKVTAFRTIPWKILTCIIPFCSPMTWTWLVVFPGKSGGEWLVTEVELWGCGLLRCCCVSWQCPGQKVSHLGQSEAIHSGSTNSRWGSPRWLSEQCMFFKILPTKLVNSDSTKKTQISFYHAYYYFFTITTIVTH